MLNVFNVVPATQEVTVIIHQTPQFGMTTGYLPVGTMEDMPLGQGANGVDVLLNWLFFHSDTLPMDAGARSLSHGDVVQLDKGVMGSTYYILSTHHDAWITIDPACM